MKSIRNHNLSNMILYKCLHLYREIREILFKSA